MTISSAKLFPNPWQEILFNGLMAISLYLILFAAHGYIFGESDLIEVLPYALQLQDPELYPHDFFVEHITRETPNERWIFVRILELWGNHMDWGALIGHFMSGILLLWGCFKVARQFLASDGWSWLAVMAHFLFFYALNLGGNELYYPMFVASTLSKAIGIWAVYFWLKDQPLVAVLFLIPATFVHPVAGSQVFLLGMGAMVLAKWLGRTTLQWREIILFGALFFLTAGLWVLFLKLNFDKGEIDASSLMEIMRFRISHHYFPSTFPLKSYLLFGVLAAVGLFFSYPKNILLFLWLGLTILGCGIYTLSVEGLEMAALLPSQWFKSTIWLKFFGIVGIFSIGLRFIPADLKEWGDKSAKILLPVGALIAIIAISFPFWKFKERPSQLPFKNYDTPAHQIAKKAAQLTPKDALFIVPFENTTFKYFSRRSSWIEYKTMVHRKDAMTVWYDRVQRVYGVKYKDRAAGLDVRQKANTYYFSRTEAELMELKKEGVEFVLTRRSHELEFPVLVENESYRIYKIQE